LFLYIFCRLLFAWITLYLGMFMIATANTLSGLFMYCQDTESTVDTTLHYTVPYYSRYYEKQYKRTFKLLLVVSYMRDPHTNCHGMHKLGLFPTTMDVTLNMLLKTASRNHWAWCTFPLKRDFTTIWKSLQNLQSSALSQSKNDHKWYSEYTCPSVSMESHLGGLHLAEKTPKKLFKNSMCYTKWKSKGQT